MALYATVGLTGLGYMSSQGPADLSGGVPALSDVPSMRSMYKSDFSKSVRQDEQQRGDLMWNAAQNPTETGVVPRPAYADMFERLDTGSGSGTSARSLTGEPMAPEQFTHNNMQPFFGGRVRQNLRGSVNETLLETFTGSGGVLQHKQESAAFFKPEAGVTNVCGMQNADQFYKDRIVSPIARNNDFPIQQVRVGPGLGQGYTSRPSGGFQQQDTLDILRPKTIDELRVLTNPKQTYESRPQGPAQGMTQRGIQSEVVKNRAENYHEQDPQQWLRTTGFEKNATERPVEVIKPTSRLTSHVEYKGAAVAANQQGKGEADDYGKASVLVYDNERQITEVRTVVSNATSAVKSIVAPFTDIMRHNVREFFVDAARTFGMMQAQIPEKPTLYDAVNHVARTTIKETLIHDGVIGNLVSGVPETYAQLDDAQQQKTTGRETLPVEDTTRNIGSHIYKTAVYDPDCVARTTIRETTEENKHLVGNVGGESERGTGAYSHIEVKWDPTNRQFMSDNDRYGSGGATSDFRPMSHEASDNMEVDPSKEMLEEGRIPSTGGPQAGFSVEGVNMQTNKLNIDSLAARAHQGGPQRTNEQNVVLMTDCENSRSLNKVPVEDTRLDCSLLQALEANPYSQSIHSVA